MSKIKYVLVALLVSMVALTGCGKKNSLSPQETIEKAAKNMQTVENLKMDADVNLGIKSESMEVTMTIGLDSIIDVKNGKMKMDMNMDAFGSKASVQMYGDFKNDKNEMIVYTKEDDSDWTKSSSDLGETSEEVSKEDVDKLFEMLESSKMLKEAKTDKENYNYEITINKETMTKLAELAGETADIDLSSIEDLKGDFVIKVAINKDTYQYSKITVDMKDMINELLATMGSAEGTKLSTAEFVITFYDYNKAGNVEIPEEVIEEAEENDFSFEDSYFDEDEYDDVLICTYSEEEDGATATGEINIGFNNDKAVYEYGVIDYEFENEEDAQAFYDEYELSDNEGKSQYGSFVTIEYDAEVAEEDTYDYETAKSNYSIMGFSCK